MNITKIITHDQDALNRLLYQYRDSTKLQGLITALCGIQIQEIENAGYDLLTRLDIDSSEGTQLDKIGEIVGRQRYGMADDLYRIWLKANIAKNTSEGDIERVLSIWRLFNMNAENIQIVEHFPAEVAIYSDSSAGIGIYLSGESGCIILTEVGNKIVTDFDTQFIPLIYNFMQKVVCAGIKFAYFAIYNQINAFGFEGAVNSSGFGDVNDINIGGELGAIESV